MRQQVFWGGEHFLGSWKIRPRSGAFSLQGQAGSCAVLGNRKWGKWKMVNSGKCCGRFSLLLSQLLIVFDLFVEFSLPHQVIIAFNFVLPFF